MQKKICVQTAKITLVCMIVAALSFISTGSHAMAADDPGYNSYGGVSYDYDQDGASEFIFDSNDLYNTDTTYVDSAGEYVEAASALENDVLEAVE